MKITDEMGKDSFRGKIFFLLSVGSTSTVILLTILWLTYAWYATKQTVERDLQTIAVRTAGEIDQYFSGKIDSLMAVRALLSYSEEEGFKLRIMLRKISRKFAQFKRLTIYEASNELVASTFENEKNQLTEDILNIVRKGEIYRSPMLLTKENLPYIRTVIPLFWQGEVFRILLADINILDIWNKIDEIRIGKTGRASILSSEGVFLADPEKERVLNNLRWRDIFESGLPLDAKEGILNASDRDGISLDIAYAAIPSTGWMLVITQERRETMHFLYVMLINALVIIFLCIVGAYYASAALSRRLSKPIEELDKGVDEISKGNFQYKVPLLAGKEMEILGKHLNDMAVTLEEKERTKEKMADLEKLAAVGELAEDVAHEINNPLSIILNYVFIVKRDMKKPDAPMESAIAIVMDEIERISRIIDAFKEFYKGKREAYMEEVDPILPLRYVLTLCSMEMEKKGITIEEEIEEVGMVMADNDKLRQVFLNFIKNAMEAMPDSGAIRVKAVKHDGQVEITVSDTGMGIKKEHLKKIFTPFFSTKGVKGTGLGLSVSYGMIKSFNGDIEVESEEGKGSNFKITLPAVKSKSPKRKGKKKPERRTLH